MGAAEGDTAPGPGKDKIRDSLPPNQRGGFSTAVIFTLERNKYAALARRGAIIAEGDPIVGATRMNLNVFYRLGFDIASGIFGDPAAGALGNTATGPGSLGIRNSLSETSQLGFDASVKLHLSRKYTP